jgi:hypothetical protein
MQQFLLSTGLGDPGAMDLLDVVDSLTFPALSAVDALMLRSMVDAATHVDDAGAVAACVKNAQVLWNTFSSDDYWRHNYHQLQPEDQEILRRASKIFIRAFANAPLAEPAVRRGIDVGSGTNLYPALLMLPWAERILLTDFSARNVDWLRHHVADDSGAWTWRPFWHELQEAEGYNQIGEPRKLLREACIAEPGYAGIEQRNVFELPAAQWDLGTMFFVAESITEDPREFRAAIDRFLGALKPGAPFAAAFMAGSDGYRVAGTRFPALSITPDDVMRHLTRLGAYELTVELPETSHRVREGYEGMIVATGFVGGR